MNKELKGVLFYVFVLIMAIIVLACQDNKEEVTVMRVEPDKAESIKSPKPALSEAFKAYWYAGEAEICSYQLEQVRYGEIRQGTAVLVFVTEDFLPKEQVKADNFSKTNTPVLKLNATKNFNTGIYPYSIMQSTFFPVANDGHAIKQTVSVQEWCGQVYAQINNRDQLEVTSHSYFQGEADESYRLDKTWSENELWTKLRIDPQSLPTGDLQIIPSLEYTRLRHQNIKAYNAYASRDSNSYTLNYPDLNRELKIFFNSSFPYDILGWEETTVSGYGANTKTLTTKATKLASIKSAYWSKNSNADEALRTTLKLRD